MVEAEDLEGKMPNFCAVVGCSNRSGKGLKKSFYRIPSIVSHQGEKTRLLSIKRRAGWLQALRRKNLNLKQSNYHYQYDQYRICSDHFITGAPATLYDVSNPDWIPSVNMGHQYFTSDGQAGCGQHKRSKKLENRNFKDRVQISCDTLADTTEGYEIADCLEFDQDYHSLHRKLQVKEETEEFLIQDSHPAFGEIRCVTIKEEPDASPSSTVSDTQGVTELAPHLPDQLNEEMERSSSFTQCEDAEKFFVKQEGEEFVLVKERAVSGLYGSLESSDIEEN
ncbi:THAP domain-containing protein 4-like isoform X2 [Myripristis murdjan]|uniref:THAP domain-containing protein 4-like isoform X2 n=1 Tax=Myripristis murdjan TaxID=586833 RepID=UPI001175EBAC|nr:THAP domain-containing protein 4-like isoform X2 [Myripristis murdjan]